jgi:hypothetical protein
VLDNALIREEAIANMGENSQTYGSDVGQMDQKELERRDIYSDG